VSLSRSDTNAPPRSAPAQADAGYFAAPGAVETTERLRALEARYRSVVTHLPAVIYVDGVVEGEHMVDVSPGIRDLLGIEPEDWIEHYLGWERYLHPDDRAEVIAASDRSVATGAPFRVEYRALHAAGHVVWVKEEAVLIHDEDGRPMHWLGVMLDVTELVTAQQHLREARSTYGALVEQIPAIVYQDLADESWTTAYVSPQIREILGVDPSEWTGESKLWLEMLHPDDRQRALDEVDRGIASGQPYAVEYRMIARDGRTVWFRDNATVLHDDAGNPTMIQGVMLDITERRDAEERLAFLAYHDHLTGLPNKAMFDELLELSLARAARHGIGCAVLALDVDNFKLVNDSLGHEAGDRLISLLAERIREATRETDLVARQGGDEFLMLLSDLERVGPVSDGDGVTITAESVANRVLRALHDPFTIDGTELYVSASIGISVYPADADDAGQLLRNADAAMFRAKAAGPGAYVIHHADDADALTKLSLSTRLRKAVEQKAWTLHYQPLVDLLSGDMVGVEALIRWPDPSGGLVPPGEFIPLAEEMGLIEAIGDWVVEEICRQDAAWRADGLTLDIGFNLSPRELWQMDPVERIVGRVVRAGMEPGRVTIEITESTAMNDPDRIVDLLNRFHDAGFRLAIDDFGTGYSSLSRLRYMPVEILKIDRTFVREVHSDPQSASMVSAIIALASNLGMESLAEGIETEAEWRFLADRGCPLGQGYFFSRPVPPEEILARHRRTGLTLVEGGLAG
jgi:diguanylate cyclase (GGDEF)-like protein/PAS domain S-box-containing protein